MNLIEQLGGYEEAKSKFRDNGSLHAERMKAALLEYRRVNNIYEVGDKVVWKESLTIDKCLIEIIDKNGDTWGIRHATKEEIAAGHRIDKKELEDLELINVSPCCKKLGDYDE